MITFLTEGQIPTNGVLRSENFSGWDGESQVKLVFSALSRGEALLAMRKKMNGNIRR